jgi:hypothetical protein
LDHLGYNVSVTSISNLTATDLEVFSRLRIPQELIAAAGIERVTDEEARSRFGIAGHGDMSGLIFPYRDPAGTHRWTCRLRRDHPELENGKPVKKYVSPYGDNRHIYFPPSSSALLENPQTAIVLVEAEKSSLAVAAWATRTNAPVLPLAIGGCWGFRGRIGKTIDSTGKRVDEVGVLSDLHICASRAAYILLDSNAETNPAVRAARRALVRELQKLGAAAVRVVDLPTGNWNGPDDFLAANSDEAFSDLFRKAAEGGARPDARPSVIIRAGEGPAAVDQAEEILLPRAAELGIFQRGGQLVRVVSLPRPRKEGGLTLPADSVIVEAVTAPQLQEIWDRLIRFEKETEKITFPIDAPARLAHAYIDRTAGRRVPVLAGTIFCPLLLDDDSIPSPGFHEPSGLYFVSSHDWPAVPAKPTAADVQDALAVLLEPFAEFPWVGAQSYAAHLSAIFTAIQRRVLPSAPLFVYRAPERRTGKSLLAESVAIIATGRPAPATAMSTDGDEFRKTITAALYRGAPIINLDNVDGVLSSPFLSMALTQSTYEDRILGESRMVQLPTTTTWTATGNNIALKSDLAVRAVQIEIDAGCEHPEERKFAIRDLPSHLLEHRTELVRAVLTVLRAYRVAGSPDMDLKPWGGFDGWSATIRGAIVFAGLPDPAGTRELVSQADPERENAYELLAALRTAFNDDTFTVRKVLDLAEPASSFGRGGDAVLLDAIKGVASRRGVIDRQALGHWLRHWKDRIVKDYRLVRVDGSNVAIWRVEILAPSAGANKTTKRRNV